MSIRQADVSRHLSFAAVGGFFGAYAILRTGILASAQTMNLLELVLSALNGDALSSLLHIGILLVYVLAVMLTVFLPHLFHLDNHKLAALFDGLCALIMGLLPAQTNLLLALYPIFFAMAFQWSSFPGAAGYVSATIFSTNNTKQASLSFAQYLCDHDKTHFVKIRFYLFTLLFFHLGAAVAFFAVRFWDVRGAWVCIPLSAVAFGMVLRENRWKAVQPASAVPAANAQVSE
jgi:uncharacterized membrane protein YoaK (UPF0700 family)